MERRPIVTTFPSSDGAFRRAVERAVVRVAVTATRGAKEELARRLKPVFPRVAVLERQLTGEPPQLYVFRDGRYVADPDDRWWEADGVACACLDAHTGRLTEISPGYAEIMGTTAENLVGHHYLEFVAPDAIDMAEAMFDALANDQQVNTEAVIQRADGTPIRIQLHATRENGEIDVRYRLLQRTSTPS